MKKRYVDIINVINLYLNDLKSATGNEIFNHRHSLNMLFYPEKNNILSQDIQNIIPATALGEVEKQIRQITKNPSFSDENRKTDTLLLTKIKTIIEEYGSNFAKDNIKIFYSWQSDLEKKYTKNFIRKSLEKAISRIKDYEFNIILDEDTRNEAGSPDVVNIILEKISKAHIFIADLTPIINNLKNEIPNPNVMFELGYAFSALGNDKVMMIFNEYYGKAKNLPFDLGLKRQVLYNCGEDDKIPEERKKLEDKLYAGISTMLKKLEES